jgi:hypothetical protein
MSDATIRAALEAAALACMDDAMRDYADRYEGGKAGPGARQRAAETVAAFLRALPPIDTPAHRLWDAATLAAAVEAAAADAAP